MKKFLKTLAIFSLAIGTICASSCSNGSGDTAVIVIKDYGEVEVSLNFDEAPLTCEHFVKLAKNGSYDGTKINRLQPDFVIQAGYGCSDTSTVKGEFSANGVENNIKHQKGTISMARSSSYDSASSQFFICLASSYMVTASLDGQYAGFGEVTKGYSVIEKIEADVTSDWYNTSNSYYFFLPAHYLTIETIKIK